MNKGDKHAENERFLASAVHYLLEIGEKELGILLANSVLEEAYSFYDDDMQVIGCRGTLRTSPRLFNLFHSGTEQANERITTAFRAVFPEAVYINLMVGVGVIDVDVDWRTKLLAEHETGEIHNQNTYEKQPSFYAGMRFSSPPETKIAQALDKLGVMYLPNCLARVGMPGDRRNIFPDFLICHSGKWGILEVDGSTYHTGNAAKDHERSRLIEQHGGIAYFTRYDAMRCDREPEAVVKEFLDILAKK